MRHIRALINFLILSQYILPQGLRQRKPLIRAAPQLASLAFEA
jgi:hypothetical protein